MFLIALIGGAISQVPGGLGVFDAAMVLLLSPPVEMGDLAAALLAFRFVYFIFPFCLAVGFILVRAGFWRRLEVGTRRRGRPRRSGDLAPPILAALAFLA